MHNPTPHKILDVLIIGAGVSGIGMASRLTREQPGKTFALLERKAEIGGTWSQFKYPGVRSDSDMFTYGYKFKPWREYQTLADGTSIRNYLNDTAEQFDVAEQIHYGVHCTAAEWDSDKQLWTVQATHEPTGEAQVWTARFIVSAQGYYNHKQGYLPKFEGADSFEGQTIHPQFWPEDLDYAGKKIVVIGSGATAVTVVPALAEQAEKVTMLQRSPTWIFSLPGWDTMTEMLARVMPDKWSYGIARWRNLHIWQTTYKLCMRFPNAMRKFFLWAARRNLKEAYTDEAFNPTYQPWEQRLCAVPDADLFKAVRSGKAEVLTDHIERFTPKGIQLKSGKHLDADIIITATGLSLQLFGGMTLAVDGQPYDAAKHMIYKSVMLQDLPNFGWIVGYINLSWTMKADMSSLYLCRVFEHMDKNGLGQVTPRDSENMQLDGSILDQLDAGYVKRSAHLLPRQGKAMPWAIRNNYKEDKKMMLGTPIADTRLEGKARVETAEQTAEGDALRHAA